MISYRDIDAFVESRRNYGKVALVGAAQSSERSSILDLIAFSTSLVD